MCDGGAYAPRTAWGSSTHLLILELDPNDSEGVAGGVVVDADPAEPLLAGFDGHPFLTGVIIDHHGSPGLADALLTADQEKTQVSVSAIRVPEAGFPFSETEADCSLIQRNFQWPGLPTAPGRAVFILQRPRGVRGSTVPTFPRA